MGLKKEEFLFIFLLVILVNISFISAAVYDCEIRDKANCVGSWHIVMDLSSDQNAHAEFPNTHYGKVVCCNWAGNTVCTGTNELIRLSSTTNAHVESFDLATHIYGTTNRICYENLSCVKIVSSSVCPGAYPMDILSQSANTNAHVADFLQYDPIKICCNNTNEPPSTLDCQDDLGGDTCNFECLGTWYTTADNPSGDCCVGTCCQPNCGSNECGLDPVCGTLPCGNCVEDYGPNFVCTSGTCCEQWPNAAAACTAKYGAGYECGSAPRAVNPATCSLGTYPCGTCPSGESCDVPTGICVADPCSLQSVYWGTNPATDMQVTEGNSVTLTVNGINCDGSIANIEIYENDIGGRDDSDTQDLIDGAGGNTLTATFSGNTATTTWTSYFVVDHNLLEIPIGNPDYKFTATVPVAGTATSANELEVLLPSGDCSAITTCADYTNENDCNLNRCNSDILNTSGQVTGDVCDSTCEAGDSTYTACACVWDTSESICEFVPTDYACNSPDCNNNNVQEPGETCDGNDLDGFTCDDFDQFSGGNLGCFDCEFTFDQCGGYVPCNNNGTQDEGEACDGTEIKKPDGSDWQCSDFDEYSEGVLACNNCQIDTSGCIAGGYDTELKIGNCSYSATSVEDCDTGIIGMYTAHLNGVWRWGHLGWDTQELCVAGMEGVPAVDCVFDASVNRWFYDPLGKSANCGDKTTTLECPAKIKLPFFSFANVIAVLGFIAVIYIFIISRKRK